MADVSGSRHKIGLVLSYITRREENKLSEYQCYEKWKDVVEISGPVGLKLIRGFRDVALRGEWKSYKSSYLNQQYRAIYKIEGRQLMVQVVETTPQDYRRKP